MIELVRYEAMRVAIAECHQVDEVKDIRDKAIAVEAYAKQALDLDCERKAREIRIRAERKCGELLKEMKESGQRQTTGEVDSRNGRLSNRPSLSDLGITRDQSSKWQQLAAIPEQQFEERISDRNCMPSTEALIRKPAVLDEPLKVDPQALWLWGRLNDFDRDGILERDLADLLSSMTAPMQRDVLRIAPSLVRWLGKTRLEKIA